MAWACSRRCQTSWLSGEQARNSMQCPDGQSLAQAQQGVRPIGHASCLIGGAHVVVRPSPAMVGPVPKAASITVRMQPIRSQPDFGSISTVWLTEQVVPTRPRKGSSRTAVQIRRHDPGPPRWAVGLISRFPPAKPLPLSIWHLPSVTWLSWLGWLGWLGRLHGLRR
jgi:hypothetical protein